MNASPAHRSGSVYWEEALAAIEEAIAVTPQQLSRVLQRPGWQLEEQGYRVI